MGDSSGGSDPPQLSESIVPKTLNVLNAAKISEKEMHNNSKITFDMVLAESNTSNANVNSNGKRKRSVVGSQNNYSKITFLLKSDVLASREIKKTQTQKNLSNNRFLPSDKGPFFVFVEGKDKHVGNAHPMMFGKWLFQNTSLKSNDILDIRSVGKNRIKITTSSGERANFLVESDILRKQNLFVYIPLFLTQKVGVIRGVSTDISEDEILSYMGSSILPISVERMQRVEFVNEKAKIYSMETCLVTFRSQILPQYITIYGGYCPVQPYVPPVRQCGNCLRYFHSTFQCRSKQRCLGCGGGHILKECPNVDGQPKCVHCEGNHLANSRNCEVFKHLTAENLKKYTENSYASVLNTQNKFQVFNKTPSGPINFDQENFPTLESSSQIHNSPRSYRKTLVRTRKGPSSLPSSNYPQLLPPADTNPTHPIGPNPYRVNDLEKYTQTLEKLLEIITNSDTSETEILEKVTLLLLDISHSIGINKKLKLMKNDNDRCNK